MKGKDQPYCSVIIVTHNSQLFLTKCLDSLREQTRAPDHITIVDSGSTHKDYLKLDEKKEAIKFCLLKENVGFCHANNIGVASIPAHTDYLLFLNPDAFLTPFFLEQAIHYMELASSASIGALTGLLLGYDIQKNQPTGQLDSAGIFQKWYGRWYDRGQGQSYQKEIYSKPEDVPALCGALMFCRKKALDEVLLGPHEVMDSSFFMYKEDIDLSLRLRDKGWSLLFHPFLVAYHCRGWQKDRTQVSRKWRLLSAKNEIRLHARHISPYFIYSLFKYLAVKIFNF